MRDIVENSQHTYADVLQRLLGRSDTETHSSEQKKTFVEGKLCTICKVRYNTQSFLNVTGNIIYISKPDCRTFIDFKRS